MQNNDFWTIITSLNDTQTSPVVLCMQNSVISIRNTSLCWSQPSSVVFACKTATFGPELEVSMGTRSLLSFCARKIAWLVPEIVVSMFASPHLWFCACKTATLGLEIQVYVGPRPHLWFCACKKVRQASDLVVSMGSSLHRFFLDAKQRLLDQNYKFLWVPDLTCRFLHTKQRD